MRSSWAYSALFVALSQNSHRLSPSNSNWKCSYSRPCSFRTGGHPRIVAVISETPILISQASRSSWSLSPGSPRFSRSRSTAARTAGRVCIASCREHRRRTDYHWPRRRTLNSTGRCGAPPSRSRNRDTRDEEDDDDPGCHHDRRHPRHHLSHDPPPPDRDGLPGTVVVVVMSWHSGGLSEAGTRGSRHT